VQVLLHVLARLFLFFFFSKPIFVQMTCKTVMIGSDHSTHHTGFVNVQNGNVFIANLYAHAVDAARGVCCVPDSLLKLQWATSASFRQLVVLETAFPIKIQPHLEGVRVLYVLCKITKKIYFKFLVL
jgi:hypothetical protein